MRLEWHSTCRHLEWMRVPKSRLPRHQLFPMASAEMDSSLREACSVLAAHRLCCDTLRCAMILSIVAIRLSLASAEDGCEERCEDGVRGWGTRTGCESVGCEGGCNKMPFGV